MSDQDFNFSPPPRREAKKAFEPPPWEQGQFEELARRKEAEKAVGEDEANPVSGDEGAAEQAAPAGPASGPLPQAGRVGSTPKSPRTEGVEEDPRIEAMLLGLKNEEPPFGTQIWKFSLTAGAVLVLIGAVIVVWGGFAMAAASRTGPLGSLGGGILVVFGLGFLGVGGWIAVRTLRQQGVL